ncbi:MAG: hypothetical protein LBU82_02285 [Treponema sp.]|jgi:hypothetical protein|nr:hypothetical protein [Treponema sp.]
METKKSFVRAPLLAAVILCMAFALSCETGSGETGGNTVALEEQPSK